jgi:hypothetical protein
MLRRTFVTSAILPAILTGQADIQKILGRWYTVKRSQGGIGAIMEFRAGGVMKYSPGAVVEFSYRFDGKQLVLKFADRGKGPEPESILDIRGLSEAKFSSQQSDPKLHAPEEAWTRVGRPEDPGHLLLGNWTGERQVGKQKLTTDWRFRADGSGVFANPFREQTGEYQFTANGIRLRVGQALAVEGPMSWEGEILVLPGNRSPTRMHRF